MHDDKLESKKESIWTTCIYIYWRMIVELFSIIMESLCWIDPKYIKPLSRSPIPLLFRLKQVNFKIILKRIKKKNLSDFQKWILNLITFALLTSCRLHLSLKWRNWACMFTNSFHFSGLGTNKPLYYNSTSFYHKVWWFTPNQLAALI